jgi:hypothetical protein
LAGDWIRVREALRSFTSHRWKSLATW